MKVRFTLPFIKTAIMKQSVKVIPEFHVNQSYLRIETLEDIKQYFGCGYIKTNHAKSVRDTTYVYVVRNRNDLLEKIIPFFRRYHLRSTKQQSFEIFARIVEQMAQGKHRTKSGLRTIITMAYQMNVGGKYRQRTKEDLFQVLQSSETIR
ncbi:MAG: LAGLIDADG family homing endonuclease [Candidatus Kerfeldbacteria bacterium]|nr:LAGLIDADG family homing endonuclease [Candidatus Kerfeldbacteria bacterium]